MTFKIDENLPVELADDIHAAGQEADTVYNEALAGAPDTDLMEGVRIDGRVLLTLDKGIADIRVYPPEQFSGIVLFRPPTSGRAAVIAFVRRHVPAILADDLTGRLIIVTEGTLRRR